MVLGSGSTCPHDFRFLVGLASALGLGLETDGEEGVAKGTWRSSILMVVVVVEGSTVGGGVDVDDEIMAGVLIAWAKSEE